MHSPVSLRHANLTNFVDRLPAACEEHGVDEYWVLAPQTLDDRFCRREGDFLTAFGEDGEIIRSTRVPGGVVCRNWLDPEKLPDVAECQERIAAVE